MNAAGSNRDAKQRSRYAQDETLSQQLPHDPASRCSQRGANGNFALAPNRAGKQQVGNVGAGNERQKTNCTEQDQHGWTYASDGQLMHLDCIGSPTGIFIGICGREPRGNRSHLVVCALQRDSRLQAGID
jgi:hypothetical protein